MKQDTRNSDRHTEVEENRQADAQGGYRATIRDYGNGLVEVSGSFVSAAQHKASCLRGTSLHLEENLERADASAKSRVRQLIMAAGFDHLLTLTFRANVEDADVAEECFESFVRRVHAGYALWDYVAVKERQKRGAWHWHLAVKGWQDVNFLRTAWTASVGDLGGQIDVKAPSGTTVRAPWQIPRLAGYLSKYISKSLSTERALNEHRFRASLRIKVPCRVISLAARSAQGAMDACALIVEELGGQVGYVWKTTEGTAWWMCSWG